MRKFKVGRLLGILTIVFVTLSSSNPALGQAVPCPTPSSGNSVVINGLVTGSSDQSTFASSTGNCISDTTAKISSYKLPSYDDLKSLFYTQRGNQNCASTIAAPIASIPSPAAACNGESVLLVTGDLSVTSPISGSSTAVIFVDGNLTIGPISANQLTYGGGTTGLVFVVKGNINIDKTITRVDAVLISGGQICTAYDSSDALNLICPGSHTGTPYTGVNNYITPISNTPLTVNGSLISLSTDPNKAIKFSRSLYSNNQAAEQIVTQPKYLAILKYIFTQPYTVEEDTTGQPANNFNGGTCTPNCPALSSTTCGQAVSDGCGGTCGIGTDCSSQPGTICSLNTCVPTPTVSFSPGQITSGGGGTITVSWQNIPNPSTSDEVAMYATGASGTNYLFHKVCGNAQAQGSCSFTIPGYTLPDGAYTFTYVKSGNYSQAPIATSVTQFNIVN